MGRKEERNNVKKNSLVTRGWYKLQRRRLTEFSSAPAVVTLCLCLLSASAPSPSPSPSEYVNHRGTNWHAIQQPPMTNANNAHHQSHRMLQQEQITDIKPHLHTLMPMQQYSPLHIPSFPGSLNVGYPPGVSLLQSSMSAASSSGSIAGGASQAASKVRGASDCPGVCPLCGATLRQARNLRRHLLSSCKYRFNSHPSQPVNVETMTIDIKPEVEMPGYTGQSFNYANDSGGSNSCERIICKPSPLPSPSPHGSNVVSPHSNVPSPPTARWNFSKKKKKKEKTKKKNKQKKVLPEWTLRERLFWII